MKRLLEHALTTLGYRVQGTRYTPRQLLDPACLRFLQFDDVICRRMLEARPNLTFIQVGAFDGVTRDPLRKYIGKFGWRGVLVEPQRRAAAQLRELYGGNEDIVVLQAAIDATRGTRTLFTVRPAAGPEWAGGLASFERESIVKHSALIPGVEEMIGDETVECVPFEDVLARLPCDGLDLLQIDAEGADLYLLSVFPFDRVKPAIIHWEIKHATTAEREDCFEKLVTLGYRLAASGDEDMMAVLL
jgi:FkbM family methyltransferase